MLILIAMLGLAFPKNSEVPLSNIHINRLIFCGEFGKVSVKMLLREQLEVGIKEPRPNGSKELFKNSLMAVKILGCLNQEHHANVVQFLGACTREIRHGKLYILMEYCKNVSLLDHLVSDQRQRSTSAWGSWYVQILQVCT